MRRANTSLGLGKYMRMCRSEKFPRTAMCYWVLKNEWASQLKEECRREEDGEGKVKKSGTCLLNKDYWLIGIIHSSTHSFKKY